MYETPGGVIVGDPFTELLAGVVEAEEAVKEQRVLNGIEAQAAVVKAGGAFWQAARAWASARKILSPMETGILDVAAAIPDRLPSDKQSLKAIEALRKMIAEGYQHGSDLV